MLRGRSRRPRDLRALGPQRELRPPTGGPAPVARLVRDDLQQPRAHGQLRLEASERPPRLDESLLRRVLGLGCVAGDEVSDSERDLLMRTHDLLIGTRVSTLRTQHELALFEWTALHCGYYTAQRGAVPASDRLSSDAEASCCARVQYRVCSGPVRRDERCRNRAAASTRARRSGRGRT